MSAAYPIADLPTMPPRVRAVVLEVCSEFRVKPSDLLGPRRFLRLVEPRKECWRRIRELPGPMGRPFSYPQIGAWFGRDHSTVVYACTGDRRVGTAS